MSLHNRLTLSIMLASIAVLGTVSWLVFEFNRERIYANQQDRVELIAEILENGLRTLMIEGRGKEFQRFIESLVAEDIEAVRIFTENGTILNSSVPGEAGRRIPGRYLKAYSSGPGRSLYYVEQRDGREVYSHIVSIKNDLLCQKCHGAKDTIRGILDVELSGRVAEQKVAGAGRRILLVAAAAVALLFVIVRRVTGRLVEQPVSAALEKIRQSPAGDALPHRTAGQDELALLLAGIDAIDAELTKARDDLSRCTIDKNLHVERMASIGELAAAVAHGIKNPLAGISGALQVLAEDFPADSPRKEIAGEVLKEIGRLDTAVKDLLFFARPPELSLIPTDVRAIIEKVRNTLDPEASRQNVKITSVSDNISEIMVDPEQMEKALISIAAHCIQSMDRGGELAVAARQDGPGGNVEITISDTGRGIPEEKVGDVFKPFFSTKHSGTGLGLAISRNIIESHKGTVTFESREGRGSTFRIVLGRG